MIELIIMLFVALRRDTKSITITVRKKNRPADTRAVVPVRE